MRTIQAFCVCATCLLPGAAQAVTLIADVNVNFETPQELQSTVDKFRDDLGANNGNAPVNADPGGRRQIDWDAAPDAISDPNPFPGDFFNGDAAPRARGIEFRETGKTTGFELSATAASGTAPVFGLPNDFVPFSEERMFRTVGGDTFDVYFFDPTDQVTPALSRGLGVVFSDVEKSDLTSMMFFDQNDSLLAQRFVEPGADKSLSFLGLIFDEAVIAKVSFVVGGKGDNVAMDDFIFGEPVPANIPPVPLPAGMLLMLTGLAALGWRRLV